MLTRTAVFLMLLGAATYGVGAAPTSPDVDDRLKQMREQIDALRTEISGMRAGAQQADVVDVDESKFPNLFEQKPAQQKRLVAWQPMKRAPAVDEGVFAGPQKRLVAWQPMKRSSNEGYNKQQLYAAIESRLMEVLDAAQRLGISPSEVLQHLRQRNAVAYDF